MHCETQKFNQFPYIPDHIDNLVLWYDPLPSLEPTIYPHLKELYIESNNISHVKRYHVENFPGLRSLGFPGGKVKCFDSGVFKDLVNLVYLSVDGNEITKAIIRELPPHIKTIDLKNNKIYAVTFSKRFYENVTKIHQDGSKKELDIYLSGNPIVCGCRFRRFLLTLDPLIKVEGECQYPLALRGKSFSEISSNCTKAETDLDISVDDINTNYFADFDDYDDSCEDRRIMKPMEVRSKAITLIGGSIDVMTVFGIMTIFNIII